MHWEPDVGLDPGSPGSRPGPKAGAKLLRHPGIPRERISSRLCAESKANFFRVVHGLHDPEIMTSAEIKSLVLYQLSHPAPCKKTFLFMN